MYRSPNRRHEHKFFYKYTSLQSAQTILVNRTLRFTSPLLFNDPFDVQRKLIFNFDTKQLGSSIKKEIRRLIETGASPDITNNPKLQRLFKHAANMTAVQKQELLNQLDNGSWRDLYSLQSFQELEKKWESTIPRTHILCLSEKNDDPVMWNSYSDSYRGVVLKLECLDLYDNLLLIAEPVIYSDKVPAIGNLNYWIKSITGQIPYDYNAIFKQLELTKTTSWSYEKEWRVISFEKDEGKLYSNYIFHPLTFAGVFLGKDIAASDRNVLFALTKHDLSHMEFYGMSVDHKTRRIVFKKILKTT